MATRQRQYGLSFFPAAETRLGSVGRSIRVMIDRRDFIADAALVAAAPPLQLLQPRLSQPVTNLDSPVFMIDGWSVQENSYTISSQVWIRVDRRWRVAWW
jgi:hypothetical protein